MKSSRAELEKRRVGRPTKSTTSVDESPPKPGQQLSSGLPDRGRPTSRYSTRSSPSRKSPNRKSPTRSSSSRKSPNRRSPARKSPARKSPSRITKEADAGVQRSPSKRAPIKSDIDVGTEFIITRTSSKTEVQGRIRSSYNDYNMKQTSVNLNQQPKTSSGDNQNGFGAPSVRLSLRERKPKVSEDILPALPTRRSSRLQEAFETVNDILSLPHTNITKTPKDIFSAEDLSEEEELKFITRKPKQNRRLSTPAFDESYSKIKKHQLMRDFGGSIGALLFMLFMPLMIFWQNAFCNKRQCSFTALPEFNSYFELDTWFSLLALKTWASFVSLLLVSFFLPIGRKVSVPGTQATFRENVYLSYLSLLLVTIIANHYGIQVYRIAYDEHFRLMVISFIASLLFSIGLFVKSQRVPHDQQNPHGRTGSFVYDFWMGREHKLSVAGVHVKTLLLRIAAVSAVYYDVSYLILGAQTSEPMPSTFDFNIWLDYARSISISPTLFTFTVTNILFLSAYVLNERLMKYSFEMQDEGVGYMLCVGYFIYPFLITAMPKYVLEHNVTFPPIVLGLIWLVALAGIYISFVSNRIKDIFRTNHLDSRVSHMESMPTFHGKRLLVSGWWAFVRHPNYLGDILVHSAWIVAWPASLPALLTIIMLVSRVRRVEARCDQRYEAAWRRYLAKVPYALVPYVY